MKGRAKLVFRKKTTDFDGAIVELVVWELPAFSGLLRLRYRFAFIPPGARRPAVLYDNHRPKGLIAIWMERSRNITSPV